MKFFLVFDNSGESLPFEVKYNHELFEFFVNKINNESQNLFSDNRELYKNVDIKIAHLHWAISKTNESLYDLIGKSFDQQINLDDYLDQKFLNKTHSDWVFSHKHNINIDKLRHSANINRAQFGNTLHELYPDEIRNINLAPALERLGYIFPFREVNMGIHRLESAFTNIEFSSDEKWEVFDNPFVDSVVTNNDVINFSFGYTYVGRQYYNKFRYFDSKLECPDNYNYETLEFAFQLNLSRPETIPFSNESIQWATSQNIQLIAEQIPFANIIDLESNLVNYRKILYRNSRDNNKAKIILN